MTAFSSVSVPVAGTTISVADFGEKVANNLDILYSSSCIGLRAATQSINNDTLTTITMDTEFHDDGAYIDISGAPTKITFPKTGIYTISAFVTFAANTTGVRELYSYVDGVVNERNRVPAVASSSTEATTTVWLHTITKRTAAEYMEFKVVQTSTGALNVTYFKAAAHLLKDLTV